MANQVQLFDYDLEAENLKRRQAVLDALQQEASGNLPMVQVGDMGAAPNIGQVLAKLGQQYFAGKQQKELAGERSALAGKFNTDMREGFEKFYQTSEGSSAPSMALQPNPDGTPQMTTVPGDRRKAIFDALASGHPVLRDFAAQQLKRLGEGPDIGEVDGILYNKRTMQALKLRGSEPVRKEFGGDLYEVSPTTGKWRKLDNAARISNVTNVNMPKGESEFDKTLGKKEAERLSGALEMRGGTVDGLSAVQAGKVLLKQGIYTGAYAPLAHGAAKAAVPFGGDPAKASRTDEFIAHIGDVVIPRLKDFGGSDTVEEMKYLQQVTGGKISMEPQALTRVLESVERKLARKLKETDDATQAYKAKGYTLPTLTTQPTASSTPSEAPAVTSGKQRRVIKWEDM